MWAPREVTKPTSLHPCPSPFHGDTDRERVQVEAPVLLGDYHSLEAELGGLFPGVPIELLFFVHLCGPWDDHLLAELVCLRPHRGLFFCPAEIHFVPLSSPSVP